MVRPNSRLVTRHGRRPQPSSGDRLQSSSVNSAQAAPTLKFTGYDADGTRIVKRTDTETTYYAGDLYQLTTSAGVTTQRFMAGRSIFAGMNHRGVMAAIQQAYGSAATVAVQGERVLPRGVTKTGLTVEMWLNKATKVIETAYPVVR